MSRQPAITWSEPVEIQWSDPLPAHPRSYSLSGLANALTVTLTIDAVAWLAALVWPVARLVVLLAFVVSGILFLIWIFRARVNAEASDWPQRRAVGWSVWGWIVPVAFWWIPFQVVADIWRAALPAAQRSRLAVLPGWWWACWLAASLMPGPSQLVGVHLYLRLWPPEAVAAAASAMLLVVIVRRVSAYTANAQGSPPV